METHRLDLGLVDSFVAESFGEPGQRTFRVRAETREASVSLWLEKEQVVMLGEALENLLERLPPPTGEDPIELEEGAFVGDLEVRLGAMSVGFDTGRRAFAFEVTEFESPFGFEEIQLFASRGQLEAMQRDIERIIAGGRPRCVLCGRPLTGEPHFCPESNGHAHLHVES